MSAAIEVNGETISTMPASVPMISESSIQPRAGMASAEAAVAVTMMPRSSQPKPIHRASSRINSRVSWKQISPSTGRRAHP
ncbi:hypothetical protein [Streptomyces sp. NPDC059371]|uniref:hypothetical protein n=1 Tax=Streptomyces sp. NPDC059371 TaxID=3346812 RepID=UPI0036846767